MHAFIEEAVDRDMDGHAVYTGRFLVTTSDATGVVEPEEHASLQAAIDDARTRARTIHVELEDGRYTVTGDGDLPQLGPAELQRAEAGRRRRPGEEWLDRTELDDELPWLVKAEIHPDELVRAGPARDAQRAVLDAVETTLEESGFTDVFIDTGALDETLEEIDRAFAADGQERGVTSGALEYVLHATVTARTWRAAMTLAVETIADALVNATGQAAWMHTTALALHEAGWGVSATAWPADGQPPGPGPV